VHHGEIEVEVIGAAVGMSVEVVVPSSRKAVVGVEMAVHDGERRVATDGLDYRLPRNLRGGVGGR
jgi:hypothetical protein